MNRHGGHVDYVAWTVSINYSFIRPMKLYMNFITIGPVTFKEGV